jgi:hypothetical protein
MKKSNTMKNSSTILLRLALITAGLFATVLGVVLISQTYQGWPELFPEMANAKYLVMSGLLAAVTVFWVALYNAFTLLDLIDQNESFSMVSVKTLQHIKYCALIFAGIFTAGMPAVFYIAQKADGPGLVLIVGVIFVGAPVLVAVFASVCQRLFQNAIDIKSENDLTV